MNIGHWDCAHSLGISQNQPRSCFNRVNWARQWCRCSGCIEHMMRWRDFLHLPVSAKVASLCHFSHRIACLCVITGRPCRVNFTTHRIAWHPHKREYGNSTECRHHRHQPSSCYDWIGKQDFPTRWGKVENELSRTRMLLWTCFLFTV